MSISHAVRSDPTSEASPGDPRLLAVQRAEVTLGGTPLSMDAIARTAAEAAAAPIGLVSLVNGEWDRFIGQHGLTGQLASIRRIPVDGSLCPYVIAAGVPVLIEDAASDARSASSPVVTDLGVRAYAGVPLRGVDRQVIGALCVVDHQARPWTSEQISALTAMAAMVSLLPGDAVVGAEIAASGLDQAGLLRALAEAFVTADRDGAVLGWNAAATRIFGWTLAEVLGRPLQDFLFRGPSSTSFDEVVRDLATDQPVSTRTRLLLATTRDGRQLPVDTSLSVLVGRSGPLICASMLDVSDQVTAEGDAKRHASFLSALLDSMKPAVFACDAQGATIFSNVALRRLVDRPDARTSQIADLVRDLVFRPDGTRVPPEEYPSVRALAGEQVRDAELLLHLPDRPARELIVNAERIRIGGITLGAVVVLHEVSEQRRGRRFRECDLAISRALVRAESTTAACQQVVEALGGCAGWPHTELWLVDPLTDALRPAATFTDGEPDRDGMLARRLTRGEDLAGAAWEMAAPVWVADLACGTSVCTGPPPRPGLRSALAVPVRPAASVVGVLTLYSDTVEDDPDTIVNHLSGIAAYVGQYLERRRTEELALELARTKDDFLTLVGHELRTPLTSISTYTQLLAESPDSLAGDGPQLVEVIRRNTESLTAIIDDLLDLAGLESGHITVHPTETDLAELIQEAVGVIRVPAERRGLTVTVDLPAQLPLRGDPRRLRQMLDNLFSNAVKYNRDDGSIAIRARAGEEVLTLTVSDAGIGIPPAERAYLFQRFFRSSAARDSGVPGTGLGLVVTRSIVEHHGGRICVGDNTPGTTMTIELPLAGPAT